MIKYITYIFFLIILTFFSACSKKETVKADPLSGNIYLKDIRIQYDYYDTATDFYFDDSTRLRNAFEFYNKDSLIFYQSYLVDFFDGHYYTPPMIIQDTIVHLSSFNYKYFDTDNLLLLTPNDCLLNMEVNPKYIKLTDRKTGYTETYNKDTRKYIWEQK